MLLIERNNNHVAPRVVVHIPGLPPGASGGIRDGPGTAHRGCPGPAV